MLPTLNNIVSLINTNLRIVTHYINYIKPILNYSIFDRIQNSFESYEKLYTSFTIVNHCTLSSKTIIEKRLSSRDQRIYNST
jgi:hypothetical protein